MEKVLFAIVTNESKESWGPRNIGILIINDQREMLLHKTFHPTAHRPTWETPYLLRHDATIEKPYDAAFRYLAGLGIEGELHEAFTAAPIRTLPTTQINHLIIALTSAKNTDLLKQNSASQCISFDQVIRDAHEHPEHYALWFRESLDGVALYLKNLLKQSRLLMPQQQVELS